MKLRALPQRRAVTGGAAVVAAAALAAGMTAAASAAPARTAAVSPGKDPYAPAYGHSYRHGAVPTRAASTNMLRWAAAHPRGAATSPAAAALTPAAQAASAGKTLRYGGGLSVPDTASPSGSDTIGVTDSHEKVYLVFFGSQWGRLQTAADGDITLSGDRSGEAPYLENLFKGLGTGGETWSGVMTQYCQGVAAGARSCPADSTEHVAYPSGGTLAGVWVDESGRSPKTATGHRLANVANQAAAHFGNTTQASNLDTQYVILSPHGTHPDHFNTRQGQFCAWHDFTSDPYLPGGPAQAPYGQIAFTNMPYLTDAGWACGAGFVNRKGKLDGVSIVAGHEYAETVTDQLPEYGWAVQDTSSAYYGYESADLCAWIKPGKTGGAGNVHLATGRFAMQGIWANDANGGNGGCELSHPVAGNGDTVTATDPGGQSTAVASPVSLQMHASDPAGHSLTYAASGLPPGLAISPAGLISGAPTTAGTYSVTVTATDSTGASGWAVFTWTVSGQLLGNPGFETGTISPWTATRGVLRRGSRTYPAKAGRWLARLDGRRAPHTDRLAQKVRIPASASRAKFSFWLEIRSNDPTRKAYDKLRVQVLNASGRRVLRTLHTYSNRNRRNRYQRHSFSLGSFTGRRVMLRFTGTQTLRRHVTSFLVDSTSLHVS